MAARGILRTSEDGGLMFWCPACDGPHQVRVGKGTGPRWCFNGNYEKPTFKPSVLVTYNGPDAGLGEAPPAVCHSFVTDGKIEFLADSTHALAGRTEPIQPFDH